jgi:hypothetical protein
VLWGDWMGPKGSLVMRVKRIMHADSEFEGCPPLFAADSRVCTFCTRRCSRVFEIGVKMIPPLCSSGQSTWLQS